LTALLPCITLPFVQQQNPMAPDLYAWRFVLLHLQFVAYKHPRIRRNIKLRSWKAFASTQKESVPTRTCAQLHSLFSSVGFVLFFPPSHSISKFQTTKDSKEKHTAKLIKQLHISETFPTKLS
jgi:hypothetical protein